MNNFVRVFTAVALMTAAAPAYAQATRINQHGRIGEVLLGGTTNVSFTGTHVDKASKSPKDSFSLTAAPTVAVFVAPNLAVGVHGGFAMARANKKNSEIALSVGPQFIGHVPMAAGASLLPKLAVDYTRKGGANGVDLTFNVDLAMHVSRDVSVTVGPQVSQQVYGNTSKERVTTYGLQLGVLGWL